MSQSFRFRLSRADWVELSTVVARRPLHFRIVTMIASLSVMVFVMAWIRSDADPDRSLLSQVLSGDRKWWPMIAFLAIFSVGMLFRHHLSGLGARFGWKRMPLADKEVEVILDREDVRMRAVDGSGFDWRFPWTSVTRLIVSPERLMLAVGPNQGLPIPRAAFATPAAFGKIEKIVLARLPKGTPHERA